MKFIQAETTRHSETLQVKQAHTAVPVPVHTGVPVSPVTVRVSSGRRCRNQMYQAYLYLLCAPVPGGPGESLLVQGQFDEGDGGELLTELLEDDKSSQQGQVLQSVR